MHHAHTNNCALNQFSYDNVVQTILKNRHKSQEGFSHYYHYHCSQHKGVQYIAFIIRGLYVFTVVLMTIVINVYVFVEYSVLVLPTPVHLCTSCHLYVCAHVHVPGENVSTYVDVV